MTTDNRTDTSRGMTDPLDHMLFFTPHGILLTSSDDVGVVVLARTLPSEDLPTIREYSRKGGVYLAAFQARPGRIFALRIEERDGQRQESQLSRAEAVAEVGEALISICGELAGIIAERRYASWVQDESQRLASIRAVVSHMTPGEA